MLRLYKICVKVQRLHIGQSRMYGRIIGWAKSRPLGAGAELAELAR